MAAPTRESTIYACHCEPVTDVTGVALSKDSLRSQSVSLVPLGSHFGGAVTK